MSNDFMQAMGDPAFWKQLNQAYKDAPGKAWDSLQDFGKIPTQADHIAEQMFPDSGRDASAKNAFRHALGTGMLTQALGGSPLAATAVKGLGYAWEALDPAKLRRSAAHRTDTLHDLNANAVGAKTAQETANQQELVAALKRLAETSRAVPPPGLFEASPGYMTRSEK